MPIIMLPSSVARLFVAGLLVCTGGCGLPRDADGTLERVRGGELRVGAGEHAPWVITTDRAPAGIEPELVNRLARQLGAYPTYRRASESELLDALERGQLDLVVGGLLEDSPWRGRVALTRPYFRDDTSRVGHVFATPSGENGWLVYVERFLAREGPVVARSQVHGE